MEVNIITAASTAEEMTSEVDETSPNPAAFWAPAERWQSNYVGQVK